MLGLGFRGVCRGAGSEFSARIADVDLGLVVLTHGDSLAPLSGWYRRVVTRSGASYGEISGSKRVPRGTGCGNAIRRMSVAKGILLFEKTNPFWPADTPKWTAPIYHYHSGGGNRGCGLARKGEGGEPCVAGVGVAENIERFPKVVIRYCNLNANAQRSGGYAFPRPKIVFATCDSSRDVADQLLTLVRWYPRIRLDSFHGHCKFNNVETVYVLGHSLVIMRLKR